jgi:GxxExxY protein
MGNVEILYRELSYAITGAAMEVHKVLGPGYLEAVYQIALAYEFKLRGIKYEDQKPLPVSYRDQLVGD